MKVMLDTDSDGTVDDIPVENWHTVSGGTAATTARAATSDRQRTSPLAVAASVRVVVRLAV